MDEETAAPILVAYDGSPSSKGAIAASGALFPERPLVVATVWESSEELAPAAVIGMPAGVAGEAARRLDEASTRRAAELAGEGAELASGWSPEPVARPVRCEGNVWATLCGLARELGAAAVVVGSRGRSQVSSALLGSVSSGLVHHAPVPVLVVRSSDDPAPVV